MTKRTTRLELSWIGKEDRPRLEPRILIPDPSRSYSARDSSVGPATSGNRLIYGDNLLALKALEQEFSGRIKCVVIDPPYNTGSAFAHYDDGVEHSLWLSLMRDRLECIWRLLSSDGSLWMTLDDHEAHYAKVLCDEVFGRANFVHNAVWQKRSAPLAHTTWLSDSHDHILIYAKDKSIWRPNRLPRTAEVNEKYDQTDEHDGVNPDGSVRGRGPWFADNFTLSLRSGARGKQFARSGTSPNVYTITLPSGRKLDPPAGTCWRYPPNRYQELLLENRITFGRNGDSRPCYKRFLAEVSDLRAMTVWHHSEVGENRHATIEAKAINGQDPFATPKPEKLIHRILTLATKPGDWVLDSFAGSGTTGAVAHKMGRHWVMVELHDQINTHILPRLRAVIDGRDSNGVTSETGWRGGGGFTFFELAPSLLEKDRWGNWVVSAKYNPAMLAEAMCKLEGFRYEPDTEMFWIHGRSTERDFIYVTTQNLSDSQLSFISGQVGPDRTLLICCAAFRTKSTYENLSIKKIPQAVLSRCEWGRDDYSLNVNEQAPVVAVQSAVDATAASAPTAGEPMAKRGTRRRKPGVMQALPLFASIDNGGEKS